MSRVVLRTSRWLWITLTAAMLAGILLGGAWQWSRQRSDLLPRGARAYAEGDFSASADLARRRLREAPEDREAIRLLARATARLGRDGSANALFARLGTDELHSEDLFLLGLGLKRAGRSQAAARVWERALALDPDHARTLEELVCLYTSQSRLIEAAQLAERLARRPGFELQGELSLAPLRAELGDPAAAAQILRRAINRPGSSTWDQSISARTHKLLARTLLQAADPAAARTVLNGVLGGGPDPEASWLLSRAFLQLGASTEAAAALEQAGSYRADHPLEWEPSPYVGEDACAKCHPKTFREHHASRHSSTLLRGARLAEFPYPHDVLRDPDDPAVTHQFQRDAGRVEFQSATGGQVKKAVIDYAFGSPDHYVSFVADDDHGRPWILRLSRYQAGRESGWVRTTGHSPQAESRGDLLGKPLEKADGVYKCLFCHSTEPMAILANSGPPSGDRAIGCERCHGPGGNHQKAMEATFPDPAIVNPKEASVEARMELCGQCHGHHQESSLARDDPYWIRFQSTSLTWSRCFTESSRALDCLTCHDPHRNADHSPTDYAGRCLACHAADKSAATISRAEPKTPSATSPRASRPPPERAAQARASSCPVSPAQGCIGCHMPPYRSAPLHATFADHYIRVRRKE